MLSGGETRTDRGLVFCQEHIQDRKPLTTEILQRGDPPSEGHSSVDDCSLVTTLRVGHCRGYCLDAGESRRSNCLYGELRGTAERSTGHSTKTIPRSCVPCYSTAILCAQPSSWCPESNRIGIARRQEPVTTMTSMEVVCCSRGRESCFTCSASKQGGSGCQISWKSRRTTRAPFERWMSKIRDEGPNGVGHSAVNVSEMIFEFNPVIIVITAGKRVRGRHWGNSNKIWTGSSTLCGSAFR